jgi:hypothetical protein
MLSFYWFFFKIYSQLIPGPPPFRRCSAHKSCLQRIIAVVLLLSRPSLPSLGTLSASLRLWLIERNINAMPSVCTKPAENGGAPPSPPSETTLGQALAIVEKKMRNLEKRKVGKSPPSAKT